jgi:hypothetical protein
MIKFLLFVSLFVASAFSAENILCSGDGSSQCYLIDNSGAKWNAQIGFTTDGMGDIFTLGDVASTDNVLGVLNSSNRTLIDNSSRRWSASVLYTTDGHGNVIPVPSGGGGGGGVTAVTATSPVVSSGGTTPAISMPVATSSANGYLASADWTTFNSKQGALSFSAPLVNSSSTISCNVASGSQPGCLASSDWTTFNSKQPSGSYLTALTGDATASGPGSAALTLATVNSNVGSFGSASTVGTFTVNGKGLVTAASSSSIQVAESQVTNLTSDLASKQPNLTFTAPLVNTSNTVTASVFTGDSGTGGLPGVVPSPSPGVGEQNYVLNANGSFAANDTSKFRVNPFSLLSMTTGMPATTTKNQNVAIISNGLSYYAVVAGGQNYLQVFNITDQANPVYRGSVLLYGAYNICPGPWPYVYVPASGSVGRVDVVSIANPAAPVDVSHIVISGSPGSVYNCAYSNGVLALATQSTGLVIADAGGLGLGGTSSSLVQGYQQSGGAKSFGVAFSASNLYSTQYVTSGFSTRLLNAWTIPTTPTPTPSPVASVNVTTVGEALGVTISGNTAYVTVTSSGNAVDLVDITTPTAMTNLSQFSASGTIGPSQVTIPSVNPSFVYVPSVSAGTAGGVIDLFDVSNRSVPVKVGTVSTNVNGSSYGGIALDPRKGYIWAADYGVAPGSSGTLDLFSTAFETSFAGSETASILTVKNLLNLPVQASGVSPSNPVVGSVALTSAYILCVYNGTSWVQPSTGLTACTF